MYKINTWGNICHNWFKYLWKILQLIHKGCVAYPSFFNAEGGSTHQKEQKTPPTIKIMMGILSLPSISIF